MVSEQGLTEAIGKLAGLYEYGHLQASTNPAEFLRQVADEITSARARLALYPSLVEALRQAEDWMESEGCDCGTDEPGTCGLCAVRAALARADAIEKGDDVMRLARIDNREGMM
jgi:hypothetical protein